LVGHNHNGKEVNNKHKDMECNYACTKQHNVGQLYAVISQSASIGHAASLACQNCK